jgi:hypothetical protein
MVEPCSCGNRSIPNINHRKRIQCWTYIGNDKFNLQRDGCLNGAMPWGHLERVEKHPSAL